MGHISQALLVLTSYLALTLGQGVNVLIICDDGNRQAENGVDTAIKYLAQNNMGNINKKSMVSLTGEPFGTAGDICTELDSMIDSGSPPDLVLDLSTAGESSEVVKSLSLTLGLPTVTSAMGGPGNIKEWSALTAEQEKYLVQVRSPADMFQYIISDIATYTKISNAAIIFDESFKMTQHHKKLMVNMPVRHTLTMMEVEGLTEQFERLVNEMHVTNFYILASPDNIREALMTADSLNLGGDLNSWVVATKAEDYSFDATCCANLKVISLHPKKPSGGQLGIMKTFGLYMEPLLDSAFYADLAAKSLAAVTKMKKDGSWPEMTYTKCSQFAGGQPVERSLDLMSALKVSGVQDVWGEFHFSTNGETHMGFQLKVHHHKAMENKLVESHAVGAWTAGVPSSLEFKSAEMQEAIVLRKTRDVIRVVSVIQPPFMQWNEAKGTYEGYAYDLMEEIKKILGIEYELYIADSYGKLEGDTENGTLWNGLIGEIQGEKADIGLGAISVQPDRETVVDFTVPFYNAVGFSVLMKKTKVVTSLLKFFNVLEEVVWGTILATYFITSFLMWIIDKYGPLSYQNNLDNLEDFNHDEKRFFDLKESLWFCMTSLTAQGGGEAPRPQSGRMVASSWWLFSFVVVASYTANLAAFLTVGRMFVDISSLDGLVEQSRIRYAAINGTEAQTFYWNMAYIETVFYEKWKHMSTDGDITEYERAKLAVWDYPVSDKFIRIVEAMKATGLPTTFDEAMERVMASETTEDSQIFALLADGTDVRYQALINCQLRIVGEELGPKPYALAVPKGSPLTEHLNLAILTLSNQRKLEGLKEKWWNQNPNRDYCPDPSTGAIGIEDMGGIFIVIFMGIGISLVTLIWEYYYFKFRASKPSDKVGDSEIKKVAEIE